MQELHWNAIYV